MTAQITDTIRFDGKAHAMCAEPLRFYFASSGIYPKFNITSTALRRGYTSSWEIIDNRLYLIELNGDLQDGSSISVATVFPDYPSCVFAHWFSDTIRIPIGELLEYVHMGYASAYEQDLFLVIDNGVVTNIMTRDNRIKTEDPRLDMFDYTSYPKPFKVEQVDLLERVDIESIETSAIIRDPKRAAPEIAFGHLHSAWISFLKIRQAGDEIWSFSAMELMPRNKYMHRSGFALVRNQLPINHFIDKTSTFSSISI